MTFRECYENFRAEKILDVKPSTRAAHAMNWKLLEPRIDSKRKAVNKAFRKLKLK